MIDMNQLFWFPYHQRTTFDSVGNKYFVSGAVTTNESLKLQELRSKAMKEIHF